MTLPVRLVVGQSVIISRGREVALPSSLSTRHGDAEKAAGVDVTCDGIKGVREHVRKEEG